MTLMEWRIVERSELGRLIHISGFITEESNFLPLVEEAGDGPLRLDLADVQQINSCGVREWIRFVRMLCQMPRTVELVRCSPVIVRQLNTLTNFRAGAIVRSIMLPYYCGACEGQELRLLEMSTSGPQPVIEEDIPCAGCGGLAEFDDVASRYLAFTQPVKGKETRRMSRLVL